MNTTAQTPENAAITNDEIVVAKVATPEPKTKDFKFEIQQGSFSYGFEVKGKTDTFSTKNENLTKAISTQICGRLYSLMLIRKQSGQKIGLNMSNEFSFSFTVGTRFINTTTVQEKLNISLKIGYSAARRRKFEITLSLIIDEILRGNNLYTAAEVAKVSDRLNSLEVGKELKKLTKPKATVKK